MEQDLKIFLQEFLQEDFEILFEKEGFNAFIYHIKCSKEYIVHKDKTRGDLGRSLLAGYSVLSFFEEKGFDFVPRAIMYNNEMKVLIQEYIGGEDILPNDLNESQIKEFAQRLAQIHSIEKDEFFEFCERKEIPFPVIDNPMSTLETYGINGFKEAREAGLLDNYCSWIEPRLNENIILTKEQGNLDLKEHLIHGDIGKNIRLGNNGKLYIIDFEVSRISIGFELGYIKVHSKLDEKNFDLFVNSYSQFSGVSLEKLSEHMNFELRINSLNDVIWAAKRFSISNDEKEKHDYEELLKRRIVFYEELVH